MQVRTVYTIMCALSVTILPGMAVAETLNDVMRSPAMEKVELATQKARQKRAGNRDYSEGWLTGMDQNSNYALLWTNSRGPALAMNWMGANIPRYKLGEVETERSRVVAKAFTRIWNMERVAVLMEVLLPHPNYFEMVELKTLKELNAYEPPILDTVFDEAIPVGKYKGRYMRTPRNRCSLLIKMAKHVMVNLSVRRCEDSHVMLDVAKALDLERLNKKLES